MTLIDNDRTHRVDALRETLEAAVTGSTTSLLGSLAAGTADNYSDIDLSWQVGGSAPEVVPRIGEILGRVSPVDSLRFDPDLDGAPDRRLVFVRFTDWPLFSRLDLEITGDFTEVPPVGSWSPQESALMNVIGALKAYLRGRPESLDVLLSRGFARIDADDPGGEVLDRMGSLTDNAVRQTPELQGLGSAINQALFDVAHRTLGR